MTEDSCFSSSYAAARQRFCEAAAQAGGELTAIEHPLRGIADETLALDVAIWGSEKPRRTLILSSGLHGVEGYWGSAVQLAWLDRQAADTLQSACGDHTRLVLLHGLNPWGFAYRRRFTEANVDPNRNFLLPGETYRGAPPLYAQLDRFLNPAHPPGRFDPFYWSAIPLLLRYRLSQLTAAIAGGQYEFPQGLFFGGSEPSWTAQTCEQQLPAWTAGAARVVHFDFHTGLGPFQTAAALLSYPVSTREREWLTQICEPEAVSVSIPEENGADNTDSSHEIGYQARGDIGLWCRKQGGPNYLYVCYECGTYPGIRVLQALRRENQQHFHGKPGSPQERHAKDQLSEVFCPASAEWRTGTVQQALAVVTAAWRSVAGDTV